MTAGDGTKASPGQGGLLGFIERAGNALPDAMTLFVIGTVVVFVLSALVAGMGGESRLHDASGELLRTEHATSLLNADGLRWVTTNLISIFINFRPLGLVLAAVIGIAVAEGSGLLATGLRGILLWVPGQLLTPATFFCGVMSSLATDAGYIVLPPLAAALYKAAGRLPLLGIAAVVAGVGAGFNANLVITGLDPMLAALTEEAAQILAPDYGVSALCNWYFMVASTAVITFVGWGVSSFFVEPRHAAETARVRASAPAGEIQELTGIERRGLLYAFLASLVLVVALALCILLPGGFLHDPEGSIGLGEGQSRFPTWIGAIVPLLILLFSVPGLVYGLTVGSIRSDRDVVRMMSESMGLMGNYIVLAFFASVFVAAFDRSNLGLMLAIEGGNVLRTFELPTWALMVAFIGVIGFINLFVGSMSAKWSMLATIFVPMFMVLGISPELTQATYRIGDSVTNIVSPLNMYLVVVLTFMRQHEPRAGLGTLFALMVPYAVAFAIAWAILLVAWIALGVPLGPGGPLTFDGGF